MLLGHTRHNDEVFLNSDILRTHAAVFGSTGSGKTGLLLGMVEELYDENIPVILVDIKGDMTNIALTEDRRHVRCLTPGAVHGEAVNVLADLSDPHKAKTAISALLTMVEEDSDPLRSIAHVYLSEVLKTIPYKTLTDLIYACEYPAFDKLGALDIDKAFPKAARNRLVRKLNALVASPAFKAWRLGLDLEMDELVEGGHITVYSVAHLATAKEQMFAVSYLLNEVWNWTRKQSGTNDLRLVVAIDECVGLLPPYPANPPTKEPIMLLLKQARAFGVGMILATQNPVDIDYKAMSNCGTWLVGRMTAERDRARVVSGMVSAGVGDEDRLHTAIASLQKRQFLLSGQERVFKTRTVDCELKGPMVPAEIEEMYENEYFMYPSYEATLAANRARVGLRGPIDSDDIIWADSTVDSGVYFPNKPLTEEQWEEIDETEELHYKLYREASPVPNVAEAFIGLTVLAAIAWGFIEAFEVFAPWLKGVL